MIPYLPTMAMTPGFSPHRIGVVALCIRSPVPIGSPELGGTRTWSLLERWAGVTVTSCTPTSCQPIAVCNHLNTVSNVDEWVLLYLIAKVRPDLEATSVSAGAIVGPSG